MCESQLQLVTSAALPYLLSVPPAVENQSGGRPVLCFLHGHDEAAPLPLELALTRHGPLRSGNPALIRQTFIVVAPQLPAPGGDIWRVHSRALRKIVQEVQVRHQGDPRRTYLTGFSFGGNGVFDLAPDQPRTWAALWSVDPTRVPLDDPQLPVWFSSGQVSRRASERFIQRLSLEPSEYSATGDRIFEDQRLDHVSTATKAYQTERIYQWLLSKSLPT